MEAEKKRLKDLEAGAFDEDAFIAWDLEQQAKDDQKRMDEIEMNHLDGLISREEAMLARYGSDLILFIGSRTDGLHHLPFSVTGVGAPHQCPLSLEVALYFVEFMLTCAILMTLRVMTQATCGGRKDC